MPEVAEQSEQDQSPEEMRLPEQPAILVVDDDMITRKLIRLTLEGKGYLVLDAPDGQTAIDIVANHQPDLVLLDLVLPDMAGLEVAGQIRAAAEKSEMPIILISGFLTKLGQARHSRIDFADCLFKPVESSRLLQVVQAHLPITSPIRQSLAKETHVLVAHDDPIQLKLLGIHLQQLGFHVATAVDGADALNQARHSSPDAIVSDVLMPHLDGFGLCQAVRADPVLAHIPVILISVACTTQEDHQFAKVVGADSLVRATPDFAEVKRPLMAMLEHKQPDIMRGMVDTDDQDTHEEHVHQFIRRLEHQARLNIHLVERLASMEARLAILAGFADKLTAILEGNMPSESVLDDLLRHCLDTSGTLRGAGYLLEGDRRFHLRAQVGVPDSATECLRTLFDRSELLNQVVASEKPFILPSASFEEVAVEHLKWPDAQPMLVVPLRLGSEMLGLLMFAWTEEELDEDWIDFIKALEAQISQTIVLARTLSQLKDSKERQTLTLSREQEARQEAERRAAELDATIASIPDAVMVLDDNGLLLRMNTAAEDMIGFSASQQSPSFMEQLGSLRVETTDGRHLPLEEISLKRALQGETVQGDVLVVHRAGEATRWVSSSAAPIRANNGAILGMVVVATDITPLHELQEQREDLIRAVSHDLRNPLTAILGQIQVIQRAAEKPEMVRQCAEAAQTTAMRMNEMIQDLLDSVSTDGGQMQIEREPMDLGKLVSDLLGRAGTMMDAKRIKVEVPAIPLQVLGDPNHLERIVMNLLTNAQKYSPPESVVVVKAERAGPEVMVSVADSGIGIAAEEVPHVFERFYRSKAGTQKVQGIGLGLYICKTLVEAHGGRIWVESEPRRGSTFYFTLPTV